MTQTKQAIVAGRIATPTSKHSPDACPRWTTTSSAKAALWGANLCLVVHWLGDSLDGTLARERGIERPRYGFYLDHLMDMLSVAAIFVGFGFSPHLSWGVAFTMIIAYYLVAIASHLQLETLGIYEITLQGVGPTEGRLFLIACNGGLALDLAPAREA